jgi:hypothetical protein
MLKLKKYYYYIFLNKKTTDDTALHSIQTSMTSINHGNDSSSQV